MSSYRINVRFIYYPETAILFQRTEKNEKVKRESTKRCHAPKAHPQNALATESRREGVLGRAGEPSVTFCGKGGTVERVTDFL
jgi:hypothetical protein